MGGFYGSTQIRTGDREAVRQAAEEVAQARGIKCLVGPLLGKWVGVYPENGGQDNSVAADLAHRLSGMVLHLLVHDDDVLAYWLYRDGVQVDSYWSLPGYFGEENRAAEEAMRGQPESFADLVGGNVEQLRNLLQRAEDNRFTFESERLAQLANLLGIANAVTAYESLKGGERHGVKGWRQFVEVPADAIQRQRDERRQRMAAIRQAKKQAGKDGLLLDEQTAKPMFRPIWCTVGNAFWLQISHIHQDPPDPVFQVLGADRPQGETVRLGVNGKVWDLVASGAGDHVAIRFHRGDTTAHHVEIGVWDVAASTLQWHREVSTIPRGFDRRGERLLLTDTNTVEVLRVADGSQVASLRWDRDSGPFVSRGCLHPDGQAVLLDAQTLLAVDLERPNEATKIFLGGKADISWILPPTSPVADIDKVMEDLRGNLEQGAVALRRKGLPIPEDWGEKEIQILRERLKAAAERPWPPEQANARVTCMAFSRADDWVFFGTKKGLFIYRWSELLAGGKAAWHFASERKHPTGFPMAEVTALAEDSARGEVVFTGGDGLVRALAVETGQTVTVLELPEKLYIHRLGLTRDGKRMCLAGPPREEQTSRQRKEYVIWQLWDYAKLRKRAAPGA